MESTEDSTGVGDHELAEAPLKSVSVCASVFVFCFCKFSSPDGQAERVRSCSPTVEISRMGVTVLEKVRELEIWLKSIEDLPSPQSQIWWGETKVIFF